MERFIFLDTETTGLNDWATGGSGVVEIGIIETDNNFNVIKECNSLINPEKPITPGAEAIHGISEDQVDGAPLLDMYLAAIPMFQQGEKPVYFIAHNAKFDYGFMKPYIHNPVVIVDTLKIARELLPNADNHKLQTLRVILKISKEGNLAHSALGDVKVMMQVLQAICEVSGQTLADICKEYGQQPSEVWASGETKMSFGKYSGFTLDYVAANDPGYVQWMLDTLNNYRLPLDQKIYLKEALVR